VGCSGNEKSKINTDILIEFLEKYVPKNKTRKIKKPIYKTGV
jgi:hypothetical protein